ncbi:MAG: hypothetical protein H0V07_11030 [Propionibacteriales bacterium]|nr:hypothetical protein [Propionibacteriales bacterium]
MTIGAGLAAVSPADAATATASAYEGSAYGTRVNVGKLVKSGPSAPVFLGCGTKSGVHKENTTAGLNLAPIATSGTVATTADTSSTPSRSRTTATTQQVNLLSGLITASAVKSVSTSTFANGNYSASGAGTTLLNLRIGGTPFDATPAANTSVDLAGIGHVVLNEQLKSVTPSSARLTVNALHLYVDTTGPVFEKGTQVIVSHAFSGIASPKIAALGGKAYGSSLNVGKLVKSGPSFLKVMPCFGTKGVVRSNTGAGVDLGSVLRSGTIRNTVQGSVDRSSAVEETTSTVESANVLNRLVSAEVVKADANASTDGTTRRFNANGSSFLNLNVAGHSGIGDNVGPNTQVRIAGLGTLWLNRVIRTPSSIEVRMIELVVTQTNTSGLAVGTDLRVAVAKTTLR